MPLSGQRIACLVGDDYEDLELWYPVLRLREAGAKVDLVGQEAKKHYKGKHGYPCTSDLSIEEAHARDLVALVIPGGFMPDKLRRDPRVLDLCRAMDSQKKVIAAICHGPQILISAKLLKGRKLAAFSAIKDDVENAGATYVDREAVRDGNLITARTPQDLPAWAALIVEVLGEKKGG